ncbi:MAG: glycosyltransferase, partial [Schleiferiaceae bacterium]|nr:glycosyltransferase [Schleiferiaceae bacterium]
MRLSVVIVSYQVKDLLHQCLCSVERAIDGIDADILVVDNASTDGTVDMMKQWHPSVKLIASQENLGFGKANNLAVAQSDSEHILFLNPDTVLPEDNLTEALAVMDADTD